MHFQYVVTPPTAAFPNPPTIPTSDGSVELLRQLLEIQREQLAYLRASHEAQNNNSRWQAFLHRWSEDFPMVGDSCLKSIPRVERAFVQLLEDLTQHLTDDQMDGIDNEFSLNEFLDRYGMRLSQLGAVLNIMSPIAEAARTSLPTTEQ